MVRHLIGHFLKVLILISYIYVPISVVNAQSSYVFGYYKFAFSKEDFFFGSSWIPAVHFYGGLVNKLFKFPDIA